MLEYNFITAFQSLLGGGKFNIEMPDFNWDNLSFDIIADTIKEKFHAIINVFAGSTLVFLNYTHFSGTIAANKTVVGVTNVVFKV
ncbi:hypothetical protein [Heyndrickxia sporothermodurans]|uniref:hypothetical protein n=1 Tax=Heyndrickxia sporothermodurans TaxID=46224 RepID=UPI0035D9CE4E